MKNECKMIKINTMLRTYIFRLACLIIFTAVWLVETGSQVIPGPAGELLDLPKVTGTYRPPTTGEYMHAVRLFMDAFAQMDTKLQEDEWRRLGYEMVHASMDDDRLLVIRPSRKKVECCGVYVFRLTPSAPVALQMPHRFHDYHTGTIGGKLFVESRCRAMAFNTAHRETVDMARQAGSYFQAFAEAWSRADPDGFLIQIHGFSSKGRVSNDGGVPAIIISNGTAHPEAWMSTAGECLRESGFDGVCLYPSGIRELGGTRNISGRVMRGNGNGRFLHLELSLSVRETLRDSGLSREAFFDCILDSAAAEN